MVEQIPMASYVRVSTMSDSQELSLVNQTNYYKGYIENNPKYRFAGIYADQLSGKEKEKRKQFLELLKACRQGKVKMIITKSISRFARNLCDTLAVVREMRTIDVGIIFEKEGINTLDPTSDLRLSLYATFAEKELSSLSENIKWAARKRFKAGEVEFAWLYGYRYLGNKQHEIIPEEAAVVKEVFERYASGEGGRVIATVLNKRSIPKKHTNSPWSPGEVVGMIRNEKYAGNAILQKTVMNERFEKKPNKGDVQQYFVENNHPQIVSVETFNKANEILSSREWKRDMTKVTISPYKQKIFCDCCGALYNMRRIHQKGRVSTTRFECYRYSSSGKVACADSYCFNEREFIELFLSAHNEAVGQGDAEVKIECYSDRLKDLLAEERELSALWAKGYIPKVSYQQEQENLVEQIKEIENKLAESTKKEGRGIMKKADEYNHDLLAFLLHAHVKGLDITFTFHNGAIIKRQISNFRRRKFKCNNSNPQE